MSIICLVKQRDYVGGSYVECYRTSTRPAIESLFKNNFEGIADMFSDASLKEKYNIESFFVDEEKIDRIGDNDSIRHYVTIDGKRTVIAETSYNDIRKVPYVDIPKMVDICVIECSKNTTALLVKREGKKAALLSDNTRRFEAFINRFLVDFQNKDIYLYEEQDTFDTDCKEYMGFRRHIISPEMIM